MPTLLEIERAIYRALVEGDQAIALRHISADGLAPAARLAAYRNNFLVTLTKALRLSFPAVDRLVGAAFFDNAARLFIAEHPPRSAWLDEYGADFPQFLDNFPPAAALAYLSGVARLEWAVSGVLHAADADPLDLACLATVDPRDHGRIAFVPHPAVALVRAEHPVDVIRRAVLAQDAAAMAAIDLAAGPVRLVVRRLDTAIEVRRLGDTEWRFTAALCAGRPLQEAIDSAPGVDAAPVLADHLAAGLFAGFAPAGADEAGPAREAPR